MSELVQPPQPIEQRMESLQEDIDQNHIPVFKGLNKAYTLFAEKLDNGNPEGKAKAGLEAAIESSEVKSTFFKALRSTPKPDRIHPADKGVIEIINNVFQTDNIVHYPLLQWVTSSHPLAKSNTGHWNSLYADIKSSLPPDMQGLVLLDMVAMQSFKQTRQVIADLLDTKKNRSIMPGWEETFFKKKMVGMEGTRYYEGYISRVLPITNAKAEEIFGEESSRGLTIARSVIYMETSKIKRTTGETLPSLRTPIFLALGQKDYFKAEELLHELILKHPAAFHEKAYALVGLEQEDIRAYKDANIEKREQIKAERKQKIQAKRQKRIAQLEENIHLNSLQSKLDEVKPYQHTAITWDVTTDMENGEQLTERFIGYVGDESSKITRYKNINGDEVEVIVPGFEFRKYVVRDNKAIYTSTSVLRANNLISHMNSASVVADPNRFSSALELDI